MIEGLKITEIDENSIIIVRTPISMSEKDHRIINEYLEARIPDREFLVLPEDLGIEVLTKKQLDDLGLEKKASK